MTLELLVQNALLEDIPGKDITTEALNCKNLLGEANLVAKQDLVLSGAAAFNEVFRQLDSKIKIQWHFSDSEFIKSGQSICSVAGALGTILTAERTALNFLGHLSGVATKTSLFVAKTRGTNCRILDTRKTTPLLRLLEKKAVRDGGGVNHRLDLSDALLIKENHIRAAGSITQAITLVRKAHPQKPLEIEVTTEKEVKEALDLQAERLLLDNMSLDEMKKMVQVVGGRCILEASGNMTLDRIESVAKLGVDFISVGALTHSAPQADVSLLFNTEIR